MVGDWLNARESKNTIELRFGSSRQRFSLEKGNGLTMGRSAEADIQITEPTVSRKCSTIQFRKGHIEWIALDGTIQKVRRGKTVRVGLSTTMSVVGSFPVLPIVLLSALFVACTWYGWIGDSSTDPHLKLVTPRSASTVRLQALLNESLPTLVTDSSVNPTISFLPEQSRTWVLSAYHLLCRRLDDKESTVCWTTLNDKLSLLEGEYKRLNKLGLQGQAEKILRSIRDADPLGETNTGKSLWDLSVGGP